MNFIVKNISWMTKNAVTHECTQRLSELQDYLVTSDLFSIKKFVN
jgi:hypothetical protein